MKKLYFYSTCMLALFSCHSKAAKNTSHKIDSVAVYTVPDEQEIDRVVNNTYSAISFAAGEQPHYDSIKNYFIPQAQLINFEGDSAQITSIDQYIYVYRKFVETDTVKAYFEKEIYGKTEQFGRIAERMSSYKSVTINSDTTIKKGVNSFQLIKTNSGWKISGIVWDVENPLSKIPRYYLGKYYTDSVAKKKPKEKHWVKAKDVEDTK